jgi:DNA (cytosine-5)-methyltransferase 1
MTGVYYNEWDAFAAQWLRNLMTAGLIPAGDVDERSITEVSPDDVRGYTQCHFFAGIGGWAFALQMAGWGDRPIWTGSCPCQPFSIIGKRKGFSDERHLWPVWFNLIRECKPATLFGEQISIASLWLDQVFADLEAEGYACAAADIPAASVGARHERQRLWFVADANAARWSDAERFAATKAQADIRAASGLVHRQAIEHLRWEAEPDAGWIADGLHCEGNAVAAYGNAIIPQVAAHFIAAFMEAA